MTPCRIPFVLALVALVSLAAVRAEAPADAPIEPGRVGPDPATYQKTVSRAISFLRTKGQADDGSFSKFAGPGVTAMVATALMKHGRGPEDPMVAKALAYLERFVQESGGIHQPGTFYRNYETSLAIVCFQTANREGRYDDTIEKALAFVREIQWGADEGHDRSSSAYGGGGYGKHRRPDLSNTSYLVDALATSGAAVDDQALKRALIFVSRCQNLETAHNTTKFSTKNPDGGFYYTPAAGGSSQAGETAEGGLRSYGSMTYAGLKSMIYAGVAPDDPRVKAATAWIGKHYTLDENPNMGDAGLYYYYHTFAKTLDAIGSDRFQDAEGEQHDWRRELVDVLARRQGEDGSWVNRNERWLEGEPRADDRLRPLEPVVLPTQEVTVAQFRRMEPTGRSRRGRNASFLRLIR